MIGTYYEITSHLGSGGIGEVYQAADSKLGRSVAIKLLPEAFMHDADRVARFEPEAPLLASPNQANVPRCDPTARDSHPLKHSKKRSLTMVFRFPSPARTIVVALAIVLVTSAASAVDSGPVVAVTGGQVRGAALDKGGAVFKGIP